MRRYLAAAFSTSLSGLDGAAARTLPAKLRILRIRSIGTRIHWERGSADNIMLEVSNILPTHFVTVTSNTTYYMVVQTTQASGSTRWYGYMNAKRIA
jgi:hypothetical protein